MTEEEEIENFKDLKYYGVSCVLINAQGDTKHASITEILEAKEYDSDSVWAFLQSRLPGDKPK